MTEIQYIAEKYKAAKIKFNGYLYLADSNFGMHKRDSEIADKIRECHDKYNWPKGMWLLGQKIQMKK